MKKIYAILLALILIGCAVDNEPQAGPPPTATETSTPAPTITATPFPCPQATPEPLWVDSVSSPTNLLTQAIIIRAGNSEWVQVDTGFDVYTMTGTFNAYGNPATVEVDLVPGETHQLEVKSRVRVVMQGECEYGGYTLTTRIDRDGGPLEIVQEGN